MTAPTIAASKRALRPFLAGNPYPGRFTDGLFFRDKMRAIHAIAPAAVMGDVLEIGGGRSGLTRLLYPSAALTTVDIDPTHGDVDANRSPGVCFVAADATALPFPDASFALVTMFDLLEHVEHDTAAAQEAWRVAKPGGHILVTTPHRLRWRYPYYKVFKPIARAEAELFEEWGHVRRGYTEDDVEALFGTRAVRRSSFIDPLIAVSHDIAFSILSKPRRLLLHLLVTPISMLALVRGNQADAGMEIALCLQKE